MLCLPFLFGALMHILTVTVVLRRVQGGSSASNQLSEALLADAAQSRPLGVGFSMNVGRQSERLLLAYLVRVHRRLEARYASSILGQL